MSKLIPGIVGGKIFNKGTNPNKEGVTYGPNMNRPDKHPVDKLIDSTNGRIKYEANGAVQLDPSKIIYLKS
jgi:hypothetical protein